MALIEKTNNPLNIRFSERNHWKGQMSSYKGFCVFKDREHGYRAAYLLLQTYIRNGYDTIREIITRWAPPSENNTAAYIDFVAEETFISPDTKLDCRTVHDYWSLIIIICAMARMETGLTPQPQEINVSLGKTL